MGQEHDFGRISMCLRQALEATTIAESHLLISDALKRTEALSRAVTTAAVKRGRKGGQITAKRGSEYFRKIAAMRKTKGGGRPPQRRQGE
jgi:hypothetical protein